MGGCLTRDFIRLGCTVLPKSVLPVPRGGRSALGTGSGGGPEGLSYTVIFMQSAGFAWYPGVEGRAALQWVSVRDHKFTYKGTGSPR